VKVVYYHSLLKTFDKRRNEMVKKGLFALVLAALVAGGVFAQYDEHKHEPFDMLLGINVGLGITPNIGSLMSISEDSIPKGNYAITFDFGLTFDYYLFNWLSFSTGLILHPDIYVLLDQDISNVNSFTDIVSTPICLTIPFTAHVNVPKVEWLYAGIGLNLNIPTASLLDSVAVPGFDTKGKFFVGLPIDIGFDFIKAGKGGSRFFFRITPEFHEKGTTLPIGFMWQAYNFRIYSQN
jgi:hypothetical protein